MMAVMTKKKKDSAAVTLGRKGGIARRKALTPERRSAIARNAALTRFGKAEPPPTASKPRWYGLFATDNFPKEEMVLFSRDKAELRERAKAEPDRGWVIEELDHDPESRLLIVAEFEPDPQANLQALRELKKLQDLKKNNGGRS